jgi:hypothetical protein
MNREDAGVDSLLDDHCHSIVYSFSDTLEVKYVGNPSTNSLVKKVLDGNATL